MPSSNLDQVRRYYDETWFDYRFIWLNPRNRAIHFGYWDDQTRSHADSLLAMNRRLATALGIRAGQRVLDAGCGVGGSALWLARTYGVEVVGITPVASQIARAQRYARDQGLAERVRFVQRDYTATGFPAASFDVIWAMESVCHAPDKAQFFAESRRLLRSGGRLGMTEYVLTPHAHSSADEAVLGRWLAGWAIPHLATRAQIEGWTREVGLKDLALADLTPQVRPSLRHLRRLCALCAPAAWLLALAGVRSKTMQGNLRGALAQYQALQRGLWFYSLLTARAPD